MINKKTLIALTILSVTACGDSSDKNSIPTFDQTNYQMTTMEDEATSFKVLAIDANSGDTVSYSISNVAANGSVDLNAETGALTYSPNANFFGEDSVEVTATDGKDSSTVTVAITVSAVNDLPVIDVDQVVVSGGETKSGQITAADVDDDALTYAIEEAPANGELIIDSSTGSIQYTPRELVSVDDSFILKVTDAQGGEVTKQLTIKTSLNSNADRAFYYYSSEASHLKKAEKQIVALENDVNQGLVFNNLAVGYARAGLIAQVERLVTSEKIVRDEQLARTMLDVADVYNQLGLVEQADDYRLEANSLYSQYIAIKGLEAFDTDDTSFYSQLAGSYAATGNLDSADNSLSVLDQLLRSVISDTVAASRTFFSYRDLVEDTVELALSTGLDTDKKNAIELADNLYTYANLVPAQEVSSGDNEDKSFYATRVIGLSDVIQAYTDLNELDKAKEAMADALALFGIVNFDESITREADEFSNVTKAEYEFGLANLVELLVALYPGKDLSAYYAGFPEGSFWIDFNIVQRDAEDAQLMASVRNLEDKSEALALINAAKDDSDLRNHFTNLVAFNASRSGAARIMKQQGNYAAASMFLDEAVSLVSSDAYINENLWLEIFVTGTSGCSLLVSEYLDLYNLSGEQTYLTKAQSSLEVCANIAATKYAEGLDGSDVGVEDAIDANSRALVFGDRLDISGFKIASLEIIDANFAKISADDFSEKIANLRWLGYSLAQSKEFDSAQSYYNQAIEQLNLLEANTIDEEVGEETHDLFFDDGSYSDYSNFILLIKQTAGISESYSSQFEAAKSSWIAVIEKRLAELEDAPEQQKLMYLPLYAQHYIYLDMYDEALAIAENEVFSETEKENIITAIALSMSLENDFGASGVASVDTDNDGLANFYHEYVSEEAITASGIVLDNDSDNDGTDDSEDAFPLDPTKQ